MADLTSRLLIFLIFTIWVHQSSAKDTRQPDGERSLMPELATMIVFVSMVAVVIIYKREMYESVENKRRCEICLKMFSNKGNKDRHRREVHEGQARP